MADLTITAANVVAGANASIDAGTAGEAVTAGQTGYKSSTTNKWMKGDTNSGTAEARKIKGIFLNNAAANQPVDVETGGDITIGATLTPGTAYYASDTPGGICPLADVGSGENVVFLGLAKSSTVLALDIQNSGVTL